LAVASANLRAVRTDERGDSKVKTIKTSDQLAEIRGRIDLLRAFEHAGGAGERGRVRRHLDALLEEEASVENALRPASDEVEAKLGRLRARLYVSEHSLAADLAEDWAAYASGVEAELRRWDDYLERLQTTAAAKPPDERARTEAAIGLVRGSRISVGERLAQARAVAAAAPDEARRQVNAARAALERQAADLSEPPRGRDRRAVVRRAAPHVLALRG
jgi:uncharacterized protein YPO0396